MWYYQNLQSQVVGVYFISAVSSVFSIIAILYMDDSDILIIAIQKDESASSIFNRSQKAANTYQSAVHQTGSAVRPDKCIWYLIQFQWKKINGHTSRIIKQTHCKS